MTILAFNRCLLLSIERKTWGPFTWKMSFFGSLWWSDQGNLWLVWPSKVPTRLDLVHQIHVMVPADSCWTGGINVTQNAIPDSLKGLYKFISDVGKSIFYISRILIWYIICRVMTMLQAFNILRYEIGQRYDSHYDAFNPAEYGPQKSQRVRPNQPYRFSLCQNCILIVYIMMLIWSSLHIYII